MNEPKTTPATAAPPVDQAKRIAELEAQLAAANAASARQAEQNIATAILSSNVTEVPAGTITVKQRDEDGDVITKRVKKLDEDGNEMLDEDGKPIYKMVPQFEEVEVFHYRIDLPASGGMSIRINGLDHFHGEVYKFTADQLRSVKEMVHRAWVQEGIIKGNNENAYRRPLETRIGSRA